MIGLKRTLSQPLKILISFKKIFLTGNTCFSCDDGYFGNPLEIGSICKPCDCNGSPCDKITGQCLNCKGNTEGTLFKHLTFYLLLL